mgnify:CR=1 FL=1
MSQAKTILRKQNILSYNLPEMEVLPTGMRAISLFTGAGGMDVGFSRAGFNILWANDIDPDSCKTYQTNHKGIIRCGDVRNYLAEIAEFKDIDLVFGGPPCQGFSVAGKMDPTDQRSKLVFSFMDVVERVQPKAFVMENVKALGVLEKWSLIRDELMRKALMLGYKFFKITVLNATEFNVPQKRERMFFIGIREPREGFDLLESIHKYKKTAPIVKTILEELGPIGSVQNNRVCKAKITLASQPILRKSPYAGMLFNGAGRPIDINGYSNTLPASMGGNKTPIIDEEHLKGGRSWVGDYHNHLMNGGKAKYDDAPKFLRRITVDEAARIQTFPKEYFFHGRQNSIYKQIGNAVPCELAYAVGSAMRDILKQD